MAYATIEDLRVLFRPLTTIEEERAGALLPIVEDSLKMEAFKIQKIIDDMIADGELLPYVIKSVIVDIVARTLMTSTTCEPMTQTSQSALGYSFSGTFLNPGGGLFIKKSELARLGLKKQRIGAIDLCGGYDD